MRPHSNIAKRHPFSKKKKKKKNNVYQFNILNNVMFMHKISTKTAPSMFNARFQRLSDSYPTNFSESNYSVPRT